MSVHVCQTRTANVADDDSGPSDYCHASVATAYSGVSVCDSGRESGAEDEHDNDDAKAVGYQSEDSGGSYHSQEIPEVSGISERRTRTKTELQNSIRSPGFRSIVLICVWFVFH